MTQFSVPWSPQPDRSGYVARFVVRALLLAALLFGIAAIGWAITRGLLAGHALAYVLLVAGPGLTGLAVAGLGIAVGLAKPIYYAAKPIVSRTAGFILITAIVVVCIGVFAHALVFAYVDTAILGQASRAEMAPPEPVLSNLATWGYPTAAIADLMESHGGPMASVTGAGKYLLWPAQFRIVRDLIGMGALFGLFQVIPVYLIWWERKVAGRIQSRLGPMRVGGWHGWSQSFADGIKLVLKEDLVPAEADGPLFRLAPYLALIPVFLAFVALPFGATYAFRTLDVALIFILAMLGIEVVGVIIAGWASNNKWSVYGAMREACQMVSYEIPMGMALLLPIVAAGTLSLQGVGEVQSGGWFTWLAFANPFLFAGFVGYFVASLASAKRAPFDLPESESELVAGFHTEYSGFRWSLFFFAEYAGMFIIAGLAAILFLGGWHSPLPASWSFDTVLGSEVLARTANGLLFSGPIWFILKAVFLLYVQIWIRWTLPRIRIDQVLYACVQVLLPLSLVLLLGNTLWVWANTGDNAAWHVFESVIRYVLGSVGILFLLGFIGIAAYGFYHRRRLVGNLAVDPLAGG